MKKLIVFLLVFVCIKSFSQQTHPPFWQDIQNFKHEDSLHKPPANPILFVGSSSFTKWTDVENYFPGYTILNRGFGGSTLPDLIGYENDVIFKYNPKEIVIYCGDNDVASSDTITAVTVLRRFQKLYSDIRAKYPKVPVVFVSIKPSPSRWNLKEKAIVANKLVQQFLKQQKNASYVDVWKPMLGKDGQPKKDIFIEDNLHMNAKGYAIWKKLIQPYLIK